MLTAFQRDRYARIVTRDVNRYTGSVSDLPDARRDFVNDCRVELVDEYRGDEAGFQAALNECAEIFTRIWNEVLKPTAETVPEAQS